MSTPYFPAFLPRLAPMRRRFKEVRQQSLPHLESLFGAFLPSCLLENASKGANSRQCIYTLRRVFFGFLYQVLNPGTSCREIVRQIQALFALQGGRPVADESGGWCLARKRLPIGGSPTGSCSGGPTCSKSLFSLARLFGEGCRWHHHQSA